MAFRWRQTLLVVLLWSGASVGFALEPSQAQSPAELFGDLFTRVQMESVFADGKTFADAVPKQPPQQILAEYRAGSYPTKEALAAFVREHFTVPQALVAPAPQGTHPSLSEHIAALWPVLIRKPLVPPTNSSALDFRFPYVVPGGRFREIYYW
ncbi:MAG: trehalase family glycosidase, partial [Gammaproteobacteria bacterium]